MRFNPKDVLMKTTLPTSKNITPIILKFAIAILLSVISLSGYAQNCSANAGVEQWVCQNEQLFLQGNIAGEGNASEPAYWSQVGGPSVVIVDQYNLNSEVTNLVVGDLTFRLNTTCEDGSFIYQDVDVHILPITIANAGPDANYCPVDSLTAILGGNTTQSGESGAWTGIGTGGSGVHIQEANNPNSPLGLVPNTSGFASLIWTITGSNGCLSSDTVIIDITGVTLSNIKL
jgi:hypothetical protein